MRPLSRRSSEGWGRAPEAGRLIAGTTLLLAALLAGCQTEGPLRFGVTYQEARGLEAGAEVHYKGLEIGEVEAVGLDDRGNVLVTIAVKNEYRSAIAENSIVEIERAGLLGGRVVQIRDGVGERVQVSDGGVITGYEGQMAATLDRVKAAGQGAWDGMRRLGSDLKTRLEGLSDSPEAVELSRSLDEFGSRLVELGEESAAHFQEQQLPALKQQAEALRQKLEAEGKTEQAKELWANFEEWLESAAKGADSATQ